MSLTVGVRFPTKYGLLAQSFMPPSRSTCTCVCISNHVIWGRKIHSDIAVAEVHQAPPRAFVVGNFRYSWPTAWRRMSRKVTSRVTVFIHNHRAVSTRGQSVFRRVLPRAGLIPVRLVAHASIFYGSVRSTHRNSTYISFSDPRPKVTLLEFTEERSVS